MVRLAGVAFPALVASYLKTSYVMVRPLEDFKGKLPPVHLKTSYVMVRQAVGKFAFLFFFI